MSATTTLCRLMVALALGAPCLAACAGPDRRALAPDEASRARYLTAVLRGADARGAKSESTRYEAAIELGRIGLRGQLPPETVAALREATTDDSSAGLVFAHTEDVGSGSFQYRVSDAARVAFLMWDLQAADSPTHRPQLLWEAISNPDSGDGVLEFCADRFGDLKSAEAVPYLLAASTHSRTTASWYVAGKTTKSLGELFPVVPGTGDALLLLCDAHRSPASLIARQALKMRGLDDPRLAACDVRDVVQALHHQDWRVRRKAAAALADRPGPEAWAALGRALDDPDLLVRQSAAAALGKRGQENAIELLTSAFSDPSWLVRLRALESLAGFEDALPTPLLTQAMLDPSPAVRGQAVRTVRQRHDPGHLPILLKARMDPAVGVRAMAVEALGEYRAPEVVDALLETVDTDSRARYEAVIALGKLATSRAVPPLLALLKDDADPLACHVREKAAWALGEIGDPRAVEALQEAESADRSELVREAATAALQRIHEKNMPDARQAPSPSPGRL